MGLRINTNVAAANTARILRKSNVQLKKSLERLSSGLRINRAADDAAGLAIAEKMQTQVRGFQVAQRNSQDGISMIQTAEGALTEVGNMMQRIRELAVQSANGTNSTANRTDLNAEALELSAAIQSTLSSTDFNGIKPFAVITGGLKIQTGPNTTADDTTAITSLGTLFDDAALTATAANVAMTSEVLAKTAINNIDAGLIVLNAKRASMGAQQNRLEFVMNVLAIKEENAMASESAIRDADIARETTAFTRNQILVSAGTSMLSQSNVLPQSALQLLQ